MLFFYWPELTDPVLSSTVFPFLFFLFIGLYCGAGVFRLIGINNYLSALHCIPLLIIIIIIIIKKIKIIMM